MGSSSAMSSCQVYRSNNKGSFVDVILLVSLQNLHITISNRNTIVETNKMIYISFVDFKILADNSVQLLKYPLICNNEYVMVKIH